MNVPMRFLFACVAVCLTLPAASASVSYTQFFPATPSSAIIYNNFTNITAMTVDSAGNLYLTGTTNSAAFPVTPGVVQPKPAPSTCSFIFDPHSPPVNYTCPDAFVAKLDPKGNFLFVTYLGGRGTDTGLAIAVDAQGAVYVAGITYQVSGLNNFPVTAGAAFTNQSSSQQDGFVTKLNSTGTALLYSTLIPGGGQSTVGLAGGRAGNAYLGGAAPPSPGGFPPP